MDKAVSSATHSIQSFLSDNSSLIKLKSSGILNQRIPGLVIAPYNNGNNTEDSNDCIKLLIPNTVVSGVIVCIEYDNSRRKKLLKVKIKELLSLVSNGNTADPYEGLNNAESLNLMGTVSQMEIYDKQLVHLNEVIDANLFIGNCITAMIISISNEEKRVQLTLRNSLIKGKSQVFIQSSGYLLHIPFNLGMPIRKESEEHNESFLANKIAKHSIKPYGFILGNSVSSSFNYELVRKIQNYDWSDEYISKGDYFAQKELFILAIENYEEAEKLDPLNTDIYIKKGNACLKMDDIKKAVSSFKHCLKIDPHHKEARDYIERIYNSSSNSSSHHKRMAHDFSSEVTFLNKKRKNDTKHEDN